MSVALGCKDYSHDYLAKNLSFCGSYLSIWRVFRTLFAASAGFFLADNLVMAIN